MVKLAVKIAISALLVWLLVRGFDAPALIAQLKGIRPSALALVVALLLVLSAVQAWRWIIVFRALGHAMPFRKSWVIVLIGLFFNQALPSSVGGDAARVWRIWRAGFALGAAINSVALDRLAALAALLLLAAASQPVLFGLIGDDPGRWPERWAVPVVIALGICGYAVLMTFDRLPAAWFRWRPARAAAALAADSRRLFLRPAFILPTLALSTVIHVSVALAAFVLARAMDIELSLVDCIVLVPPVMLVAMIPVTIAGWGVREGAMVTALGLVGVPPEKAFVLSVLIGLAYVAVGLPGGLIWLLTGRSGSRIAPPEGT